MPTRQEKARSMLEGMGITSAEEFTENALSPNPERNRKIVQAVIFEGATLAETAERFGLSRERVRSLSLSAVRKLVGRYE